MRPRGSDSSTAQELAGYTDSKLLSLFISNAMAMALTRSMPRPLKRSSAKLLDSLEHVHAMILDEGRRRGLKLKGKLH